MTLIQAGFLGLVEGVTEFLPVSSTAHLIVVQRVMGIASPSLFFDTVVQLGALGAVIVYFRKKIVLMIQEVAIFFGKMQKGTMHVSQESLPIGLSVLIASVPVLVVGFLLRKKIESMHESLPIIAFMSIAVGLFLAYTQYRSKHQDDNRVTTKNLFVMGLYQILALIPGTSRSGIVIAGGLFERLSFKQALEYSFFMSLPSLGAAGFYELLSSLKTHPGGSLFFLTSIATLVSFISALGVIHSLLTWVKKIGFMPFVVYRIIFGIGVLFIR